MATKTYSEPEEQTKPPKSEVTPGRIKKIQAILDARGPYCTCDIRADMTDEELKRVESCTPMWICSTLDRIRRTEVGKKTEKKGTDDGD